jgi:hypothetical protein
MIRGFPWNAEAGEPAHGRFTEGYISMRTHVQIACRWRDAIAEPLPRDQVLYATPSPAALRQSVAHAALGQVAKSEAERAQFMRRALRCPSRYLHNRCIDLFDVAEQMLDGELEYRKGTRPCSPISERRSS